MITNFGKRKKKVYLVLYTSDSVVLLRCVFCVVQVFLEHRNPEEVLMLIGTKTNGATPLVMACRNGHYDVVEYLVDRCMADLEQPGSGKCIFHLSSTDSSEQNCVGQTGRD